MTQIKPLRAVYYNPEKIQDFSQVVCPPYDVIGPKDQLYYHNLSPYNFIRVDLGLDKDEDSRYDNKYTRAKKTFNEWLEKQILTQDGKPSLYFYKQEYLVYGQKYVRVGFIGLLKLQDKEESKVYPHENTHMNAKMDRLRLWRNVGANLSPIFVCFSDKDRKVEQIFSTKVSLGEPMLDILDVDHVRHVLWRLDDPKLIGEIKDTLSAQPLFIADGHHRYEVALEYRRMKLQQKKKVTGKEDFNYVLTYFTNLESKDLLILPIHRVIRKFKLKVEVLEEFFRIDKVKHKEDLLILLAKAGQNEHAFGLYTKGELRLLRLKNRLLIDRYIKEGSAAYKRLDASILKALIFDRLKIASEEITYTKDINEAIDLVDTSQAEASFIMNSVKVKQLREVALNGERMPPKTTYFYPKVLSGLAVYKLES